MCDAAPKSTCQGRHIVVDVMKDVSELKSELAETKTEVAIHFNETTKREQTQEHLQVLMAQIKSCLQKLRSKMRSQDIDTRCRHDGQVICRTPIPNNGLEVCVATTGSLSIGSLELILFILLDVNGLFNVQ